MTVTVRQIAEHDQALARLDRLERIVVGHAVAIALCAIGGAGLALVVRYGR